MHQFEVLVSALLLAVLAVSVLVVSSHLTDLDILGTCWSEDEGGTYSRQPVCERFWDIVGSEAVDGAIGGVAFLLTFPVVARRRPS